MAMGDMALLIYMGLSFVPGMCTYNPFIINLWMLPPLPKTIEEI